MQRKNPWHKRKNLFSTPMPKAVEAPKVKWRLWPILWLALKRTCTVIGAGILVLALITFFILSSAVKEVERPSLPRQMVLTLELDGKLGDLPQPIDFSDPFAYTPKTMKNFTDALSRAKDDPRVEGIYARLKPGHYALAHIQEMRAAIKDFRTSGKFAYIYAPSYDNGLGGYYLAAAFDEIWMQVMGSVMITGISAEMPFLRGALDKIGIEPQFFQRKEYKSAYESLTHAQMSDANREAMAAMINDFAAIITADIQQDRGIDAPALKALVDRGILMSDEAAAAGVIDRVAYEDALIDKINIAVSGDANYTDFEYIDFDRYMQESAAQRMKKNAPDIALVYASGVIVDSKAQDSGLVGDGIAAADEIAQALSDAADDETIDGVVLRIDSPGGSPVASETILHAVKKVQEQGKSVTVSMGPAAASGGYWIASAADQIFVLPTTLTGSIGVLGGKISAQKLWSDLGVNWDGAAWGENAGMFSLNTPFSESETERMNVMLDRIYDGFIERVADGRKMSVEDVENRARGRVWVGKSAVENGLADQLGGLNEALDYAAAQVGAKDRFGANVVIMPKPLTPIEQFVALLEGQVRMGGVLGAYAPFLKKFQPVMSEFLVFQDVRNKVYSPIAAP